jgi:phage terminase small subunit
MTKKKQKALVAVIPDDAEKEARRAARKLTRRQEKFVKELVSNDGLITLREAAIRAGYPVGSAHVRAHEMTNQRMCPHVVAKIQEYREELDEMYGVGYKKHVRDLQKIRDAAMGAGAYSAAVMAEYRRGQAQGDIYVSKSEIRTGSIDQMSREDVERELERIRASFEPVRPIIDVTPEPGKVKKQSAKRVRKPRVGAVEPDTSGDTEVRATD